MARLTREQLTEFAQKVNISRKAITDYIKSEGKQNTNVKGEIPCPVCETGELSFTYAGSYNKHVHGKCDTQGCVVWME